MKMAQTFTKSPPKTYLKAVVVYKLKSTSSSRLE